MPAMLFRSITIQPKRVAAVLPILDVFITNTALIKMLCRYLRNAQVPLRGIIVTRIELQKEMRDERPTRLAGFPSTNGIVTRRGVERQKTSQFVIARDERQNHAREIRASVCCSKVPTRFIVLVPRSRLRGTIALAHG